MVRTQEERNSEEVSQPSNLDIPGRFPGPNSSIQPSNLDIPGRFPGPNSSIQPDDINRRGSARYPSLTEALQREGLQHSASEASSSRQSTDNQHVSDQEDSAEEAANRRITYIHPSTLDRRS